MMTDKKLREIEARLSRAGGDSWVMIYGANRRIQAIGRAHPLKFSSNLIVSDGRIGGITRSYAKFIAKAPGDVRALLNEVWRLRALRSK